LCFLRFACSWTLLCVFTAPPYHGVHQRRLAGLDLLDSASQCWSDLGGVFNGTFAIPPHAPGDMGKVGRRRFEVHTDMSPCGIGAALVRHVDLMGPVVVVSAIV